MESEKFRSAIAAKVRDLRKERHWTQADLAKVIGLSQNRLSEIERGEGSFSAEQLLLIMKTFNVTADSFAPSKQDESAQLQGALARLGAAHLHEQPVVPTERLETPGDVMRETLLTARSPRQIASLAPLIVWQLKDENISLAKLKSQLAQAGFERRLGWALENTLQALEHELKKKPARPFEKGYQRAATVIRLFLAPWLTALAAAPDVPEDILDPDITSERTVAEVREASSGMSRRWRIISRIDLADFVVALQEARGD